MADSVTLTRRRLLEVSQGQKQLDAIRENDKEFIQLQFDSKVAYRLMRTSVVVEREKALFDKLDRMAAQEAGFYEHMQVIPSNDAGPEERAMCDANARKADAYQRARAELLDEEVTIDGVMLVSVKQLLERPEEDRKTKSRRNPVPQSVINKLAPILQEEDV